MKRIICLTSGLKIKLLTALAMIMCGIIFYLMTQSHDLYTIQDQMIENDIHIPQIYSQRINTNEVNDSFKRELYGPYPFLAYKDTDIDMHYEVVYSDSDVISVVYRGVYVVNGERVNDFCFGLTIEVGSGKVLSLSDLFNDQRISKIKQELFKGNFVTEYATLGEGKGQIQELLKTRSVLLTDQNKYQYFLNSTGVGLIITGFPQYMGNYNILYVRLSPD